MKDKKRSLRMRNFSDSLSSRGPGVLKVNLFNPILPLDLSKKTITDIEIKNLISTDKSFKNAIFTGSTLNDITFKDIDLTGAKFLKATLNGVIFEKCTLTRAVFLLATLNSVTFESCTLTGVNFTEANFYTKIIKPSPSPSGKYTYIYTSFVNIDKFNNALFKKAKLYGVAFENCNLTKADFSEAELTVISYEDEDEEYTEEYTVFNNVNLEEANFTSAILYAVRFVNNVYLKKVIFTKAKLDSNELYMVYLEDIKFDSADFKKVDFSYANYFPENINKDGMFLGLDFSNAKLQDVNFTLYPIPTTKKYSKLLPEVNFSKA